MSGANTLLSNAVLNHISMHDTNTDATSDKTNAKSNQLPKQTLPRLPQTLQINQLKIPSSIPKQLIMRPMLHDPALVENVNHIGLLDRAQPMRNGDGGATLRRGVEGRLHHFLRLRVERRRGFVEEEDLGVAEESAGDGDALLLAAGEHAAFAADDGGEAVTAID